MNNHLRSQEFVDALDGILEVSRLEHLDACAECRAELAGLRSVMSNVQPEGAVPEPSPLFWDHFSERVRAATAASAPPRPASWWQAAWQPVAGLAAAAAIVALVFVSRSGPAETPAAFDQASLESSGLDPLGDDVESSLAFVSAAASDLSWEEARAADLTPRPQVVDSAIEALSSAQRAELIKLIREDLRSME